MATAKRYSSVRIGYYLFASAVFVATIFALFQLAGALVASLVLSFLLSPIINFAENRGVHRVVVVLGIYLVVGGLLLLLVLVVGPILSTELQRLTQEFPTYEAKLAELLINIRASITRRLPGVEIPELYPYVKERIIGTEGFELTSMMSRLSGVFSILTVAVLVPIITFFFVVDGHVIQKAFLRMIPNRYFEMAVLLISRIGNALQSFIRGQLIDALYVGVMTTIGMAAIGLPYFVVIGIFAGLGNLIPYLGPIMGAIPALVVMLLTPGWFTGANILIVAIIFAVVQFTEGTFVYPLAIGKSVDLHPLVVILGITIGGQLAGIVGMLIAVPLVSIVKVIVEVVSSYLKSYKIL